MGDCSSQQLLDVRGEKIDQGYRQGKKKDRIIEDQESGYRHNTERYEIRLYLPIREIDIPDT
jgi:hypothetical protein